jgi:hypothetical protein
LYFHVFHCQTLRYLFLSAKKQVPVLAGTCHDDSFASNSPH